MLSTAFEDLRDFVESAFSELAIPRKYVSEKYKKF